MSVTEYKRRRGRTYILIGALFTLIPACIICLGLVVVCRGYREQSETLKKENQDNQYVTAVVLQQNVAFGEQIEESMLSEITVCAKDLRGTKAVSKKKLAGMYAKGNFDKGTLLTEVCVYGEQEYSSDTRRKTFDFIELNPMARNGEYVDVRITYPNGEDYIVVSCKQIQYVNAQKETEDVAQQSNQISMEVTEEEILRLASAYVDHAAYAGTRIYAVSYLDRFQKSGTVDYPVNMDVFELLGWNPNAVGYTISEQEQQHRSQLEQNLSLPEGGVQQVFMEEGDSFFE